MSFTLLGVVKLFLAVFSILFPFRVGMFTGYFCMLEFYIFNVLRQCGTIEVELRFKRGFVLLNSVILIKDGKDFLNSIHLAL